LGYSSSGWTTNDGSIIVIVININNDRYLCVRVFVKDYNIDSEEEKEKEKKKDTKANEICRINFYVKKENKRVTERFTFVLQCYFVLLNARTSSIL